MILEPQPEFSLLMSITESQGVIGQILPTMGVLATPCQIWASWVVSGPQNQSHFMTARDNPFAELITV